MGLCLQIWVKNVQYFSIKITDCNYEIHVYHLKLHVLFMQAANTFSQLALKHLYPGIYTTQNYTD